MQSHGMWNIKKIAKLLSNRKSNWNHPFQTVFFFFIVHGLLTPLVEKLHCEDIWEPDHFQQKWGPVYVGRTWTFERGHMSLFAQHLGAKNHPPTPQTLLWTPILLMAYVFLKIDLKNREKIGIFKKKVLASTVIFDSLLLRAACQKCQNIQALKWNLMHIDTEWFWLA